MLALQRPQLQAARAVMVRRVCRRPTAQRDELRALAEGLEPERLEVLSVSRLMLRSLHESRSGGTPAGAVSAGVGEHGRGPAGHQGTGMAQAAFAGGAVSAPVGVPAARPQAGAPPGAAAAGLGAGRRR